VVPNAVLVSRLIGKSIDTTSWFVPSKASVFKRYVFWDGRLTKVSNRNWSVAAKFPMFPERSVNGAKDMLSAFLALADAPDQSIVDFVEGFGPLCVYRVRREGRLRWTTDGVLDDALIVFHPPNVSRLREHLARFVKGSRRASHIEFHTETGHIAGIEALYVWRYWSRRFRAALNLWKLLREDKASPRSEEWILNWKHFDPDNNYAKHVWSHDPHGRLYTPAEEVRCWKLIRFKLGDLFAHGLRDWMEMAGLDLRIQYGERAERWIDAEESTADTQPPALYFNIKADHVFAGLVMQLIAAISGVDGFAVCSSCGSIYPPTRQPRAGQMNYCSESCRKRAVTIAMRRHRERKRARASRTKTGSRGERQDAKAR
jgi:hypothetical protein